MKRRVFFVSDRTGITAEVVGRSLLTQFPDLHFEFIDQPFVDEPEKVSQVIEEIQAAGRQDGIQPLVFSTFVEPQLQTMLAGSGAHVIELFSTFLKPLEDALGTQATRALGRMHGMGDERSYYQRMEAVNFTLSHDDGIKTDDLDRADVVLLGVSRCGKTPTCIYLAMQYYVHAANYPLTDEDLEHSGLPTCLHSSRNKLFGLNISPERLSVIRSKRRPNSRYASLAQCRREVTWAEALYRQEGIPFIQTTSVSVEEIAIIIRHRLRLH